MGKHSFLIENLLALWAGRPHIQVPLGEEGSTVGQSFTIATTSDGGNARQYAICTLRGRRILARKTMAISYDLY